MDNVVNIAFSPEHGQQGRKGIAYDWQSLLAEAEATNLDAEFANLAPAVAQ